MAKFMRKRNKKRRFKKRFNRVSRIPRLNKKFNRIADTFNHKCLSVINITATAVGGIGVNVVDWGYTQAGTQQLINENDFQTLFVLPYTTNVPGFAMMKVTYLKMKFVPAMHVGFSAISSAVGPAALMSKYDMEVYSSQDKLLTGTESGNYKQSLVDYKLYPGGRGFTKRVNVSKWGKTQYPKLSWMTAKQYTTAPGNAQYQSETAMLFPYTNTPNPTILGEVQCTYYVKFRHWSIAGA